MARDFSPVSRFFHEELDTAIPQMESLLAEEANRSSNQQLNGQMGAMPDLSSSFTPHPSAGVPTPPPSDIHVPAPPIAAPRKDSLAAILHAGSLASPPFIPPNLPPITLSVPYRDIKRYSYTQVNMADSISLFAPIWQQGDPIVVTGCLEHFRIDWTPDYFIQNFGDQTCIIIECQEENNMRVTVRQFFEMFGRYNDRKECWKLKDWPPSTDFRAAFPELYRDFSNAVPVPDYVRRDGVANIGSHFPVNTVAPDLGPKMYNALASTLSEGSKGTTRLHMDMADAVNVMTYAENSPDGSPGCAAWDLFRACDSDKLRHFLNDRFAKQSTDPIHAQNYYLDEQLRKELYDKYQVTSYRVYQRPGEAVFIPAGCAHQVANLADCIKVAIDFVSVENIGRCESLTKEFRDLNQKLLWKEDVLQLRTMMWFAWLSTGVWEKGGSRESVVSSGEEEGGLSGKRKGKGRKKGVGSA